MRFSWSSLLQPRIEAVGLEIGASSLKLVELTGPSRTLRAYARRPTPPGVLMGGQVVEPAALAQEIRELFHQAGVRKRYVVTALPSQATVVRTLQVPRMPLKEMEEAVRWEAERYIPFPIDEVILDFAPLEASQNEEASGDQVQVVVAAARQEMVASLVEALKGAGLIPLVVDVKPLAGLYPLEGLLEGQTAFVVEIGGSTTTVALVQGTNPLAVRALEVSGQSFTEAIARAFGLDSLAAEEVKLAYGLATLPKEDEELLLDFDLEREKYSPARIYDAIRPVLVELTQELRRSLEFFRIQLGLEVNTGVLYGGGSRLRGLSTLLQDALGLPFQEGNPWGSVQVDGRRFDPEELKKLAPEFTVPVGLGIRGVSPLD